MDPLTAEISVFTDGGSRGNPGPAAIGVIINNDTRQNLYRFGQTIGIATNNIAEYQAVVAALQWLLEQPLPPKKINFFLDSTLVVNQLNGSWKIKDARLRQKVILIRQLEAALKASTTYTIIPRTQNSAADHQVNLALDRSL